MIKYYPYVDATRANKDGSFPVYIIFKHNRGRFFLNTGLTTRIKFTGRDFPKKENNSRAKTAMLTRQLSKVEEFLLEHDSLSPAELKEELKCIISGKEFCRKSFADYVEDFARTKRADGTKDLYIGTAKKVREFDITATFDSITPEWLSNFEAYYLKTMSVNGLSIPLRNIRTVFNWAIDNEWTEKYPFRRFKIRQEKTRKRALTPEQFAMLRDYPVEEWQMEYRDLFVLMVYLCGINAGDLLELRDLTDNRCVYHRKKTGKLYDIAVEPEALEIINRYKGQKFLLNCLDSYGNYKDYLHHLNDGLKKIGRSEVVADKVGRKRKIEYTPLFPELTTYWARHTWATTAAMLDIPKETIGAALGHSDTTTTDIYIAFDHRKVDEANRKVIDYLNSIKSKE